MKHVLFVVLGLVLLAPTASADVTVTTAISVASTMSADGTMTMYVKGTKVRSDTNVAGQSLSILIDAAAKQQWMINHGAKTIEPFNPGQVMTSLPITFGEAKVSVAKNGQTKEILGRACQGFTLDITLPVTFGTETITMKMSGTAWVTGEGPGVAEYKASTKLFADAGFATSPFAQGPQAKAMAEATRALTEAGIVLEQELKTTMTGTGPMAQAMGQSAGMTMTTKVTGITTTPIPDSQFVLPEGYTKK